MAIITSGPLSLNAIHIEAGGSSGTSATINDADIRGLTPAAGKSINTASGSIISFSDLYGASSAYSIVGTALPNSETYIAGPTGSILSEVTDGNINTMCGIKYPVQSYPSAGGDPTEFRVFNTDIRDGVQDKLGTSIPSGSSVYDSFNTNGITVTGWVYAYWSGQYWTMDGKTEIWLCDKDGTELGYTYVQGTSLATAGTGWAWREFSVYIRSGTHPYHGTAGADKVAKWVHGGCNTKIKRTTYQYTGIPAVSDVVYNLDFSAT